MDEFADRLDEVLAGRRVPASSEHELRDLANLASAVTAVPLPGPSAEALARLRGRFERTTAGRANPWADALFGWLGFGPAARPFTQRLAAGIAALAIGGGAAGAATGVSPAEAGQAVVNFAGAAIRNLDPRDDGGSNTTPTPDAGSSPTATPTEPAPTAEAGEPTPAPGGGDGVTPAGANPGQTPQATLGPGETSTPQPGSSATAPTGSTATAPTGSTATAPAASSPTPDIPEATVISVPPTASTPDDDDEDNETPTPGRLATSTPDDDDDDGGSDDDHEDDDETPTPGGDDD